MAETLDDLLTEMRTGRRCAHGLPLGPRPVVQASATARLLVTSQAPGTRVHMSGIPFDDRSGDVLRGWLDVTPLEFYDAAHIAIMPMGFCYPGRLKSGGDAPPRPECAARWRQRLLDSMPDIQLTLLIGMYAQNAVLGPGKVAERVRDFRHYLPRYFPLPHPSWRSSIWIRQNPWFADDVLPELRRRVRALLNAG